MRARVVLLLVLVGVTPVLAGCLGGTDGGPRLAEPTDQLPFPTVASRPPTVTPDFADPGYVMETPWQLGDGWDYESNLSNYRTVRVVEMRYVRSTLMARVEETAGVIGNPPKSTVSMWVDTTNWTRVNATDGLGAQLIYRPYAPLRANLNGSYGYNESVLTPEGPQLVMRYLARTTFPGRNIVTLPWGNVEAARIEHRITSLNAKGEQERTLVTHWVHRDFANDVKYDIDGQESYRLVAFKVGDRRSKADLLPT